MNYLRQRATIIMWITQRSHSGAVQSLIIFLHSQNREACLCMQRNAWHLQYHKYIGTQRNNISIILLACLRPQSAPWEEGNVQGNNGSREKIKQFNSLINSVPEGFCRWCVST